MSNKKVTKSVILKGFDKDDQEMIVNIITDQNLGKDYMEAIGQFNRVTTIEVNNSQDVIVNENIEQNEVFPVDKTWADFKWQKLTATDTCYYIVTGSMESGFQLATSNEAFPALEGVAVIKGILLGGQDFLAPQDTVSFNITNAAGSDNRYTLNEGEFCSMAKLIEALQLKNHSEESVKAVALTFTRA